MYSQQEASYKAQQDYLHQLGREIYSNLNQVTLFESNKVEWSVTTSQPFDIKGTTHTTQVPIVPVMIVYEAGLQNGMIVKLPPSTQNSLFTAYTYGQRVLQQSLDYKMNASIDVSNEANTAIMQMWVDAFKHNLSAVYERGFYLQDDSRTIRSITFWVTVIFGVILFAYVSALTIWSILSFTKNKG